MKKISLIILLLVSAVLGLKAQSYSLRLSNSDLNCYLDFFDNGAYLNELPRGKPRGIGLVE